MTLIIKRKIRIISEVSCDTKDWLTKIQLCHYMNKLKYMKVDNFKL